MSASGATCETDPARRERRGLAWITGGFALCPCHLPATLTALTLLLSGTALGTLVAGHLYLSGFAITAAWGAATWRGFRQLRLAQVERRRTSAAVPMTDHEEQS